MLNKLSVMWEYKDYITTQGNNLQSKKGVFVRTSVRVICKWLLVLVENVKIQYIFKKSFNWIIFLRIFVNM